MTPQEYDYLRDFLRGQSGLDLSDDKRYLVEARLGPVARRAGIADLSALIGALKLGGDMKLRTSVVEAMTTNESSFFRDRTPFDHFKDVIVPHMLQKRATKRGIKVWCAAASTGQEPYSLAISSREDSRLNAWHLDILATDIAETVMDRGKAGIYSQFEVQRGLPIQLLVKYFTQQGDMWELDPSIRRMVRWQKQNLLANFTALGRFDVVFCRNVLIYFDRPTKTEVLSRIADALEPDGYLILGAAETVVGLSDRFEAQPNCRGLYRPLPKSAVVPAMPGLRAVGQVA
ncbi:CheR family methyltransferase [Microbaculum marinisediminis]|uniref:protein-glutamate O-methyltransferase n=1 Tax=Microbaculum marinisediminis TaxID=2931392 RepID=A0AAW5QW76_9HYPH|nr:protein-glutamate O-methyltransferase CheR [Microbaculum sp. A6E488]MCT8971769.1 protein-glutamate O-methyltransferase CheR [Microbaculum sp. A6E488]